MTSELVRAERLALSVALTEDVAPGMRRLIDAQRGENSENPFWDRLDKFDYAADAEAIGKRLTKLLSAQRLNAKTKELWLLLDSLNMPAGKGIEVCAASSRNGQETVLGEVASKGLSHLFRNVADSLPQISLGLGYLGLAVKQAVQTIPSATVLGDAKKLRIAIGFHDGELVNLGTVSATGLELVKAPRVAPTKPAKQATNAAPAWPSIQSKDVDWLLAAGRFALGIPDESDRARALNLYIEMLDDRESAPLAAELADALSLLADRRIPRDLKIDAWLAIARVRAATGDKAAALKLILQAEASAGEVRDEFFRRMALEDVHRLAAKLGIAAKLKTALPDNDSLEDDSSDDDSDLLEDADNEIAEIEGETEMLGSYHHALAQMERAANQLFDAGHQQEFLRALARIERVVAGWKLAPDGGWIAASVHTGWGRLLAKAGRMPEAMQAFARAEAATAAEPTASARSEHWSALATAYAKLRLWSDAERAAKQITSPSQRREALAALYLRSGDESQLAALLAKVQKPKDAADLARQLSFVQADED